MTAFPPAGRCYPSSHLPAVVRTGDVVRTEEGGYARVRVIRRGQQVRLEAATEAAWAKRPLMVMGGSAADYSVGQPVQAPGGDWFRVAKITRRRFHADAGWTYIFRGPRLPDEASVARARRAHWPTALGALHQRAVIEGARPQTPEEWAPLGRALIEQVRRQWHVAGDDAVVVTGTWEQGGVARVAGGAKELLRIAALRERSA